MEHAHNIVVGIDFGTTYTAVAWVDASQPHHVEIIRNWPTAGQVVSSQVPSEIAYHSADRTLYSWGYNISPLSRKIKWFKLSLEVDEDVLELPFGLTSVDVIYDFLAAIQKHVMATLVRRMDSVLVQQASILFALTVPAIWSDSARRRTQDAAIKTEMGKDMPPQIFSEPECAAIHALKDLNDIGSLRCNDRLLVCDAGGGTVDIITYEVVQIRPLSIGECTVGTGDYCGSTFVDREFERFLTRRMGSQYNAISPLHKQQIIKNFEATKMAFRDEPGQEVFHVSLPPVGDIESIGVQSGNLPITRVEMRALFDPIVDRVISLISGQAAAVSSVDLIILVGGFGESEYLYQRVLGWAKTTSIRVLQPREASTAIVRGAVMKGLETIGIPRTKIARRARRWYGVTVNETFVNGQHPITDRYTNPHTGQTLAKNQIRWFIEKDQLIPDEQTFRKSCLPEYLRKQIHSVPGHAFHRDFRHLSAWEDSLVSCSADTPPSRFEPPVVKLCTITSDLTHVQKKRFTRHWRGLRPYKTAHYILCLGVQDNNLAFKLEFRGHQYGLANIEFD
ncbi:MAG: hypothetical protein Q9222_005928 [Ikaeria aurantiellina]